MRQEVAAVHGGTAVLVVDLCAEVRAIAAPVRGLLAAAWFDAEIWVLGTRIVPPAAFAQLLLQLDLTTLNPNMFSRRS